MHNARSAVEELKHNGWRYIGSSGIQCLVPPLSFTIYLCNINLASDNGGGRCVRVRFMYIFFFFFFFWNLRL